MMKLVRSNPWRDYGISRVFRTAFYSSESLKSSSPPKDSIHTRIFAFRDSNTSIIPLLDRWVEEGGEVKVPALFKVVKQLRTYRRYSHALQILQWMTDEMNFKLTPGGTAVQLDLISKAHSIDKAEEYFNAVPESARLEKVQGALLNSYVEIKSIEKAEDLFQKMKDSGIINSALTYNVMLSLYYRMEDFEKVNNLAREMEEKDIEFDSYTLCIRLNAYASSDLEEMEKLLVKMEADSHPALNFHAYFIAAKGYARAGLSEKLLPVIRKSEKLIKASKEKRVHYLHLISLYAAAGQKSDVHRVWKRYKKGRVSNNGYVSVLSSLTKIEDIEGAEKIFEEWVSGPAKFDSRIVNLMISMYCKERLAEKAFGCAERVLSKGHELDSGILQCLANLCGIEGLMPKVVDYQKKAICHSKGKWRLNRLTLAKCLEYLKKEGDLETCHEILKSLRENGNFSDDVCDKLVEFVNSDEESGALAVLEADGQKKEAETSA